jgi:CBS domain-containing protein
LQGDREQEESDRFQTAAEGIPSETRKGDTMGHQTVQEAMTSTPTAITPDTTAQEAARLLKTEDVGSLPIVEEGRLIGVVTDRDLALRVIAEARQLDTSVGEIASKDLVTIDPQQSLEEAARLMAEHQVRRLPVVEEDGRLVGMLAQADVAQAGHDTLTGEVVQKISQ